MKLNSLTNKEVFEFLKVYNVKLDKWCHNSKLRSMYRKINILLNLNINFNEHNFLEKYDNISKYLIKINMISKFEKVDWNDYNFKEKEFLEKYKFYKMWSFKMKYLKNRNIKFNIENIQEINELFSKIKSKYCKENETGKKSVQTKLKKYGKTSFLTENSFKKSKITRLRNKGINTNKLSWKEIENEISIICKDNQLLNIKKRISKKFNLSIDEVNTLNNDIFEKYKKEVFLEGIYNCGLNTAKKLNKDIKKLSKKEIMNLSGYSKKHNYSQLTESEKENYTKKWMITHLKNFYKNDIDYDTYSFFVVKNLYTIYLNDSNRLRQLIHENGDKLKYKNGYYFSKLLNKKVYYRSSYEETFLKICDKDKNITSLICGIKGIKYTFKDKVHFYFPDFIINDKYLVEIKPFNQLKWEVVIEKGKVGSKWAKENNLKYIFITEFELYKNKNLTIEKDFICLQNLKEYQQIY